jgi:hypothetical protein
MNRVRMGIESGSERILKFYKRPTTVAQIDPVTDVRISNSLHIRRAGLLERAVETRRRCMAGYAMRLNAGTEVRTSLPNGNHAVWIFHPLTVCMLEKTF